LTDNAIVDGEKSAIRIKADGSCSAASDLSRWLVERSSRLSQYVISLIYTVHSKYLHL